MKNSGDIKETNAQRSRDQENFYNNTQFNRLQNQVQHAQNQDMQSYLLITGGWYLKILDSSFMRAQTS